MTEQKSGIYPEKTGITAEAHADRVRRAGAVIQCITNIVTVNDCANILLAAGASPIMAHHPAEVEEIQAGCGALVGNLGATENFDALFLAVRQANRSGHPVVIDPVGAAGSSFRREYFRKLAGNPDREQTGLKIAAIRGNYAEIRALAEDAGTGSGVDSRDRGQDILREAKKLANATGAIVIASGAEDVVTDGTRAVLVENGSPMMRRITGSGCMASCLLGAYLAGISPEEYFDAAWASTAVMGICGELAGKRTEEKRGGTMTFRDELIDAMSLLSGEEIKKKIHCRFLS